MSEDKDIEVSSLNIAIKLHYKNEKGLTRVAGLEFEIEIDVLEEELANKSKWNKFIGDMVKDAYEACIDVAKDEYRGKARRTLREEEPAEAPVKVDSQDPEDPASEAYVPKKVTREAELSSVEENATELRDTAQEGITDKDKIAPSSTEEE